MADIRIPWSEWKTVKRIGNGSFGSVYEIKREDEFGFTEKAALKVISIPKEEGEIDYLVANGYDNDSITEYYRTGLKSILDEYAMMARLKSHPNIVGCEDRKAVKQENGMGWDVYIRMELLKPFVIDLKDNDKTEQDVIKLGKDLLNALKACHELNIVHRDIKPENIFITEYGDYKLGDFGVARIMSHTTNATRTGTLYYMAPEVYKSERYGKEADIYSLGMVLYWLLNERKLPFEPTDHLPFPNEKEEAKQKRLTGETVPDPISGSERLKLIVKKALAYDPKERYRSAEEMLKELLKVNEKEDLQHESSKHDLSIGESYVTDEKKASETKGGTIRPDITPERSFEPETTFSTDDQAAGSDKDISVNEKAEKEHASELNRETKIIRSAVNAQMYDQQIAEVTKKLKKGIAVATFFGNYDQCKVSGWRQIKAISAGNLHTVGLKKDGTVIATGYNYFGQCDVADWQDIKAISAGENCTVGLKKDGTVIAAGRDSDRLRNVSEWKDITAISAGGLHIIGLKKGGTVVVTGDDFSEQCNASDWNDIIAISAGSLHIIGLKKDGTVTAAGNNDDLQCNVSDWVEITAIAAGKSHTIGLKKDGTVVAAGANFYGQCNVSDWNDIIAISAGRNHTVGLKKDGTVVATGENSDWQCNVSGWEAIAAIAAGDYHTVGLK